MKYIRRMQEKFLPILFIQIVMMSSIHSKGEPISIKTAEELMNDMSNTFRLMQNSPQCEAKLRQVANTQDYCENLQEIACATQPNPRRDRTGGVYTHENARRYMDVPNQTFEPFSASVMGYINGRIRRNIENRPDTYEKIFQSTDRGLVQRCTQKVFFAFLRINRYQFSATGQQYRDIDRRSHFDYASISSEDIREDELRTFLGDECEIKDRDYFIRFMTSRAVRDFRKEVDEQVLRNFERTPVMENIRTKIFPDVKEAAIRLITRSDHIKPDSRKAEMIRRIRNTGMAPCDGLGTRAFGETMLNHADRNGNNSNIMVCPLELAQCQSEFCIVRGLAHEIFHSFDMCIYRDRQYEPTASMDQSEVEKNHPLGDLIACTRTNVGSPSLTKDQSVCDNLHLNEALADQGGNFIMAEYFSANPSGYNPPLSDNDYRRGFANAPMCRDHVGDNSEISNYPGDRQRVQILIDNPRIRSLMNCPLRRSTASKPVCQL